MDLLPVPIDSVTIQPVSTTKNGQCLNKVKRTLERVSFGLVMKYCKDRSKLFDNYFSPKSICLVFLYNKNKNTAGIKEITAKIEEKRIQLAEITSKLTLEETKIEDKKKLYKYEK